jgi:hypothetical protein
MISNNGDIYDYFAFLDAYHGPYLKIYSDGTYHIREYVLSVLKSGSSYRADGTLRDSEPS